ncbi:LacI family DNA-binding transcriptional regulator [Lactobacillus sp. LL6]|uniref:LacI family DNA-binding transcriptional regulator n=1 Tax=Lactobacillus sp. LL6 TaxID=2596827 RepID=UPI001185EDE4|nr:LacI family DNA-binding transcriptional regulator [Lactobacillus sp. LL6]TSO26535.1 LacI family transcriptional regulator [Lactobacillus sp. LL6]
MTLKMYDIAKLAGVSISAVSIALNGKEGISQETREKIFKIINDTGYQPLRKRKKGGIRKVASCDLIIISDENGIVNRNYYSLPFFDHLVTNLSQSVTGFGTDLRINNLKIGHLKQDLTLLLKAKPITNAIVLGTDLSKQQVKFINEKIQNVVFLDTYFEELNCDFVTMDNYHATYQAAEYILNKGITKVGYAALTKENANFLMRRAGFFSALEDHHIMINKNNFYKINPLDLSPDAVLRGFSSRNLPEAIFCENDYLAIRIIKECSKLNIKIPQDLKIMGFDDINESQLLSPSLTTIHVPIDQIVNQVIFQLQSQVAANSWQAQKSLVGTKIIKRESL